MSGDEGQKRPYRRLTEEERACFFRVLRETGNRKAAAAAIGVEPRSMDQRRESDAELDRGWREALEEAHRRLSPASGPFDLEDGGAGAGAGGGAAMIRRGKNGRLQVVSCGEGRWSAAVEARFLARLRECGSVRGAARAVGFNENSVWQRRRAWPAFAEAIEAVLEEAELELEFRLAFHGNNVVAPAAANDDAPEAEAVDCPSTLLGAGPSTSLGTGPSTSLGAGPSTSRGTGPSTSLGTGPSTSLGAGQAAGAPRNDGDGVRGGAARGPAAGPLDPDAALRFLKWREEKRRGRGRWARKGRPPSIEEVTEKIVRRVEAIKRHRREQGGDEG